MLYIYNIMIYNRVKLLRTEIGVSRKALADAVGVNFQTIGYLERGDYNASLELAFKLADHFGVRGGGIGLKQNNFNKVK